MTVVPIITGALEILMKIEDIKKAQISEIIYPALLKLEYGGGCWCIKETSCHFMYNESPHSLLMRKLGKLVRYLIQLSILLIPDFTKTI